MNELQKVIAKSLTDALTGIGKEVMGEDKNENDKFTLKSSDGNVITLTQKQVDEIMKGRIVKEEEKKEAVKDDADKPVTASDLTKALETISSNFTKALEKISETKEDRVEKAQKEVNKSIATLLKAQGIDKDNVEIVLKEKKRGAGSEDDEDEDGVSFKFKSEGNGEDEKLTLEKGWPDEKPAVPASLAKVRLQKMAKSDPELYEAAQREANNDLWKQYLFGKGARA